MLFRPHNEYVVASISIGIYVDMYVDKVSKVNSRRSVELFFVGLEWIGYSLAFA